MKPSDIKANEHVPYFGRYISQAPEATILEGLQSGLNTILNTLKNFPAEKHDYRYEEGKWTVKDMLQHIIDTERIFAYRALRIARGDKSQLQGYEQDDYVGPAKANDRPFEEMLEDYKHCRENTVAMFRSFDDEMLGQIGTASGGPMSARAAGYIIVGHELHHMQILQERYL
jgi:uncharacterized damage-inducible protein DinB